MSILRKNFEISVWDDVWDSSKGKFVEKRIGVIGNQDMTSPCRAIEPSLTRNVNGTKKFTFKMYKYCRDEITGEKILNPFSEWLVNERKVKLKRGDTTYDFLIKNIQETSANYLYTYQLEDANITELSKNGYNVVLDTQAENNLGTLQKLAEFTLTDTDWEVESEKFVEKIEEGLVYLKVNTAFSAKQIKDQGTDYNNGISVLKTTTIPKDSYILGFYSCCVNKPYRFQFLYFGSGDAVKQPWYQTTEKIIPIARNDKRIVDVENCQYYFDIPTDSDYSVVTTAGYTHFILPKQVGLFNPSSLANAETRDRYDTLVSSWYRGERYGFVQDQIYSAKLDKYLNVYGTNGDIYGYYETEYHSPILINNTITGPEFDSTTGWKIAQFGAEVEKIKIEPVQGRFPTSGGFVSSQEELKTGAFSTSNKYAHYLKLTLPKNNNKDNVVVLNTGIYDNRTTIENFEVGDIWALRCDYRIGNTEYSYPGTGPLVFDLSEYTYLTKQGYYQKDATQNITFSSANKTGTNGTTYKTFTVSSTAYTKEDFKKDCKLYVSFGSNTTYNVDKEVYIKDIQLFKTQLTANGKILPSMADMDTVEGTTVTTYKYFTKSALDAATSEQDLVLLAKSDKLLNNDYPPYFVEGAQKVRTVSAKESNYFNILQSIAETFQAWLTLEVTRDESGAILRKIARFKNYVGKKNYAGFRYGVNLKDIQRTFESNALVTKLIVKTNKNKYGDGGFCTIQRAGSNETGENFIYDLQYYTGNNQSGEDITGDKNAIWNVNNYYSRLKRINTLLKPVNEELSNTSLELVKLKAKKEVADAAVKAAASGLEETRNSFSEYTAGMNIESISFQSPLKSSSLSATKVDMNDTLENSSGKIAWSDVKISSISITQNASSTNNWTYKFTVNLVESVNSDTTAYFKAHPYVTYNDNTTEILKYTIPCELSAGDSSCNVELAVAPIDFNNSKIQQLLAAYAEYLTTDDEQSAELAKLNEEIAEVEEKIETLTATANLYLEWKSKLNLEFYKRYSRFIAEGTWVDEKYSDDEKYYNDALSVLYNSCYPRTAYTINVAAIEGVEGYEDYTFDIGDQTYVFDPQFFGENAREPVIVAEITEAIDNPSAVQIKVQNFKNQFQDLFQKITATVQSVQYSTGAYEKAAALAEAGQAQKYSFLSDALEDAEAALQVAGQQTVVTDGSGITVHKEGNPREALRLVSGAILFSTEQDGEQKWKTGITPKGISADLVTAGQIDTGAIRIMNGKDETFKWDTNGITAYDYEDGALNKEKFVRLDRHGLYGVSGSVDGDIYSPDSVSQVDADATFALTWEGLKVTGDNGGTARIGKQDGRILQVQDRNGQETFSVSNEGKIKTTGIEIISGTINGENLASTNYVDGKDIAVRSDLGSAIEAQAAATLAEAEGFASGLASGLQSQIDGEITTWFEEGTPISMGEGSSIAVNSNPPSKNWDTQEEKIKHEGDLYYDTNTQYCFRWVRKGTSPNFTWTWEQIADEGIVEALAAASRAQDTADGKRTIFSTQPTPPYQVNDLWAVSVDTKYPDNSGRSYKGELLQCKTAKNKGESFAFSDWRAATKYTDNTELDNFKVDYNATLQNINSQLDAKAETHYGPTDPAIYSGSNAWGANRVGDLWHCTVEIKNGDTVVRGENTEWIWQGTTSNGTTIYAWHEMAVADEVFDIIDGKSNIFTTVPSSGTQVNEGDILIPVSDIKSGGKVLYYAGKVYRYVGSTWKEVNYTDTDGARNYVLLSKEAKTSSEYLVAQYNLAEDWIKGETYSISIKGTVNDSQKFAIWANGTATRVATLTYNSGLGLHTAVFAPGDITTQTAKTLRVYNYPDDTASSASIEWITLTKNNKPVTTWTAAPEDVLNIRDALQSQIDKKADIYYQATDPSSGKSWGADQIGNLWRKTTTNEEFVWIKNSDNTYGWHEMEVPNAVFDAYDGKSTMYVTKPSSYKRNDVWILDKEGLDTSSSNYDATYPPYKLHSWVICVKNTTEKITTYNKSDWEEITRYTDDTAINNMQIGGKNLFVYANKGTVSNGDDWQSYNATLTETDQKYRWNVSAPSGNGGFKINSALFEIGKEYICSYHYKKTDGQLIAFGGLSSGYTIKSFIIDGINKGALSKVDLIDETQPVDHFVEWHFVRKEVSAGTDKELYIQLNRGSGTPAVAADKEPKEPLGDWQKKIQSLKLTPLGQLFQDSQTKRQKLGIRIAILLTVGATLRTKLSMLVICGIIMVVRI